MKIDEDRQKRIEALVGEISTGHTEKILALWAELEKLCVWYCRKLYRVLPSTFLLEFEDLTQCGFIALTDALRHYAPERAGRFTFYYLFWLTSAIYRENGLNTGGHHEDGSRRFDPAIEKTSFRLDAATDESGEKDGTLLDILQAPETGPYTIGGVIEHILHQQLHRALEELILDLPEKEKFVIREKYYSDRGRQSIANQLHISKYEVDSLEEHALVRLRSTGKRVGLEQYLDCRVNCYSGTGLQSFKANGTSSTERHAFRRMDLEVRYKRLNSETSKQ